MKRIDFSRYDIVAFTCSLNQTIPSLAMAKQIKLHHPNIKTIFGGATFDGDVGLAYLEAFPFIDFCISGEGEKVLPNLVNSLRRNNPFNDSYLRNIGGLCYRDKKIEDDGKVIVNSTCQPMVNLDESPIPDYTDFYASINSIKENEGIEINAPIIYFESSRGCWWRKCTFCSYSGKHAIFRSKSASRLLNEIIKLSGTHKSLLLYAADNVLDKRFFKDFLPRLKEKGYDISIWYQVRVDMTKQEIAMLSSTGIKKVHAGIESLHSGLLRLIHKGTLAIENIQLLKWCYQYQINVSYNILVDIPGEQACFYEEMLQTMEKIKHLTPPSYPRNKLEIVRFSKYFTNPGKFGISRLEPMEDYRYLFPENADLTKISSIFTPTFVKKDNSLKTGYNKKITEKIKAWHDVLRNREKPLLIYSKGTGFIKIFDTRCRDDKKTLLFEGLAADIYLFCDKIRTQENITLK